MSVIKKIVRLHNRVISWYKRISRGAKGIFKGEGQMFPFAPPCSPAYIYIYIKTEDVVS